MSAGRVRGWPAGTGKGEVWGRRGFQKEAFQLCGSGDEGSGAKQTKGQGEKKIEATGSVPKGDGSWGGTRPGRPRRWRGGGNSFGRSTGSGLGQPWAGPAVGWVSRGLGQPGAGAQQAAKAVQKTKGGLQASGAASGLEEGGGVSSVPEPL